MGISAGSATIRPPPRMLRLVRIKNDLLNKILCHCKRYLLKYSRYFVLQEREAMYQHLRFSSQVNYNSRDSQNLLLKEANYRFVICCLLSFRYSNFNHEDNKVPAMNTHLIQNNVSNCRNTGHCLEGTLPPPSLQLDDGLHQVSHFNSIYLISRST